MLLRYMLEWSTLPTHYGFYFLGADPAAWPELGSLSLPPDDAERDFLAQWHEAF